MVVVVVLLLVLVALLVLLVRCLLLAMCDGDGACSGRWYLKNTGEVTIP